MKKTRILSVLAVCILVLGMLTGCASKFDAPKYLQGVLDNSYKNDPSIMVSMDIAKEDECAEIYNTGLDTETSAFMTGLGSSDEEVKAAFREVFALTFSKAKYEVGEATKQSDDSYLVDVSYSKMNVFVPAFEKWYATITSGDYTFTSNADAYILLADCMKDVLAGDVSYEAPQTMQIRVELNQNVYSPNQNDLMMLENNLFDANDLNSAF